MEGVTNTVSSTANNSAQVVKGATSDIVQFQFYKNPVFIVVFIYFVFIFGTYLYMPSAVKNSYVFSDKFRDKSGSIYWKDMLTYPYDTSKSTGSFIFGLLTPPIIWYLISFSILCSSLININQVSHQAYFYSVMMSYLMLLILFTIHMIIFNFIIRPSRATIEITLGDPKKVKKTYESFYRTQWVLLFTLSPLYVCMIVYIMRKLNPTV